MIGSDLKGNRVILIIKPPGGYLAFTQLASKQGWFLRSKHEGGKNDPLAYVQTYKTTDGETTLHYVEDDLADFPYIEIIGRDSAAIAEIIRNNIDVYAKQELFDAWDDAKSIEDAMDAILAIEIMAVATESREGYLERLKSGLQHPEEDVRSAALTAFSYRAWEELRPVVEDIRDHDPAADPGNRARALLAAWDKLNSGFKQN